MNKFAGITSITITLSDDRLERLNELANGLGITAEELVSVNLDDLLARPDAHFEQAVDRILRTTAGLYHRLSK